MSEESTIVSPVGQPVKKARKPRAKTPRKPAGPRKAAAKMVTLLGRWVGSLEDKNLRFEVHCECAPGGVREIAVNMPPDNYDTITGRKGSVLVEEKVRKAVTLG